MRADNGDIPPGEQAFVLQELQNLLEKQIDLANQGNIKDVEAMAGQCEPFVAKIRAAGLLKKPEYKAERERLAKLYRDLQLALSTQKGAAAEQLKLIRKHKRTLAIYRGNV